MPLLFSILNTFFRCDHCQSDDTDQQYSDKEDIPDGKRLPEKQKITDRNACCPEPDKHSIGHTDGQFHGSDNQQIKTDVDCDDPDYPLPPAVSIVHADNPADFKYANNDNFNSVHK